MKQLLIVLLMGSGVACGSADATRVGQARAGDQLAAFVDEFVTQRPASQPSELSAESFQKELEKIEVQLSQLRGINRSGLSVDDDIDWRLAESILVGQQLQLARVQLSKKDPRIYLHVARTVQGTQTTQNEIQLTLRAPGDPYGKVDRVLRILEAVPPQLENGKRNLTLYVPRFQELSVLMAEGALRMFDEEIPAFARLVPRQKDALLQANASAREAMESYVTFLKRDLPKHPRAESAVGKETYDAILQRQLLLPYDSDALYKLAWEHFDQSVRELERVARGIDATEPWQAVVERVRADHPEPSTIVQVTQEWVDKARAHVATKKLVPMPWRDRFVVLLRAEHLRSVPNLARTLETVEAGGPAPQGTYPDVRLLNVPLLTSYYNKLQRKFARAGDVSAEGDYLTEWSVDPFQESWPDHQKREYLSEHDWAVIIVMAAHESYPGHQVQGLYWMHNPRKLRRERRVFFGEGWGFYSEHLMQETGFLPNERIHLRHLHLRLWRIARAIIDVGVHTGKLSEDDALRVLSDRGGFPRWALQFEADIAAQAPGTRTGWLLGLTEILKIREEFQRRTGGTVSLGEFHERLLKVGDMPPALMREGIMAGVGRTN